MAENPTSSNDNLEQSNGSDHIEKKEKAPLTLDEVRARLIELGKQKREKREKDDKDTTDIDIEFARLTQLRARLEREAKERGEEIPAQPVGLKQEVQEVEQEPKEEVVLKNYEEMSLQELFSEAEQLRENYLNIKSSEKKTEIAQEWDRVIDQAFSVVDSLPEEERDYDKVYQHARPGSSQIEKAFKLSNQEVKEESSSKDVEGELVESGEESLLSPEDEQFLTNFVETVKIFVDDVEEHHEKLEEHGWIIEDILGRANQKISAAKESLETGELTQEQREEFRKDLAYYKARSEDLHADVLGNISKEEYEAFVKSGEISEEHITGIVRKLSKGEHLSTYEQGVYGEKAEEIEGALRNLYVDASPEDSAEEAEEEPIDPFSYVEGSGELPPGSEEFEEEIVESFEELPEDEKKEIGWNVLTFGYNVGSYVNEKIGNLFTGAAEGTKNEGKEFAESGTFARFYNALGKKFKQKSENATERARLVNEAREKGGTSFGQKVSSGGYTGSALLRWGRVVFDTVGWTSASWLRGAMFASMATRFAFDAGKEARFSSREAKEKTQIEDIEEASEEAWALYEDAQARAGEGKEVKIEDLNKAYIERVPKEVLERLEKTAGSGTSLLQKVFRKHLEKGAGRLQKKIDAINSSDLSEEKKKMKRDILLSRFERSNVLKDYVRILSRQGTVDGWAMTALYGERASKALVYLLMADSLGRLMEGGYEALFKGDKEIDDIIGTQEDTAAESTKTEVPEFPSADTTQVPAPSPDSAATPVTPDTTQSSVTPPDSAATPIPSPDSTTTAPPRSGIEQTPEPSLPEDPLDFESLGTQRITINESGEGMIHAIAQHLEETQEVSHEKAMKIGNLMYLKGLKEHAEAIEGMVGKGVNIDALKELEASMTEDRLVAGQWIEKMQEFLESEGIDTSESKVQAELLYKDGRMFNLVHINDSFELDLSKLSAEELQNLSAEEIVEKMGVDYDSGTFISEEPTPTPGYDLPKSEAASPVETPDVGREVSERIFSKEVRSDYVEKLKAINEGFEAQKAALAGQTLDLEVLEEITEQQAQYHELQEFLEDESRTFDNLTPDQWELYESLKNLDEAREFGAREADAVLEQGNVVESPSDSVVEKTSGVTSDQPLVEEGGVEPSVEETLEQYSESLAPKSELVKKHLTEILHADDHARTYENIKKGQEISRILRESPLNPVEVMRALSDKQLSHLVDLTTEYSEAHRPDLMRLSQEERKTYIELKDYISTLLVQREGK